MSLRKMRELSLRKDDGTFRLLEWHGHEISLINIGRYSTVHIHSLLTFA